MEPATEDNEGMSTLLTLRNVKLAAPSRLGKLMAKSRPLAEKDKEVVTLERSFTLTVVKYGLLLMSMAPTAVNSIPEMVFSCVLEM